MVSSVSFGLGCFHFFVSLVPRSFQWLLNAIGYVSDRQLGIEELRRVQQSNGIRGSIPILLFQNSNISLFE